MIEPLSTNDTLLKDPLKAQANILHLATGLGVTLVKENKAIEILGDKSVQAFMKLLDETALIRKAFESAQGFQQISTLCLGNLAEVLYLPLGENGAWLIGPYRMQSSKCPMSDSYFMALSEEDRQQLISLCGNYPLKGDMAIEAVAKTAFTLSGNPIAAVPPIVKLVEKPYSIDFPPSEINRRMIKPIYAYIQEQENPNIILMIRDFVADGNAAKAIEIYQKSIQQIARPLVQKTDAGQEDLTHRLGILYSIFYKLLESSADPSSLIQVKNKYITQFSLSKCTQEMDLITIEMLSDFASQAKIHLQIGSYAELIQKAILYIHEHAKSKISLKDIAASLHVNASYLSSIFKKETGIAITLFIAELKMEDAKRLLENTNLAVTDICYQVGYDNPSYFTEVFKKTTGMTPKEYKLHFKLDKYTP